MNLDQVIGMLMNDVNSTVVQKFIKQIGSYNVQSESVEGNQHDDYEFEAVTLSFINHLLMSIKIKDRNKIALPSTKEEVLKIYGDEKESFFKRDDRMNYVLKKSKITFELDENRVVAVTLMAK